jgi:hypothetical protein
MGKAGLPSSPLEKKGKNERFIDFTSDPGRMDICAGMAFASHGYLYMSAAGLSGPGQEGEN